MGDFNVSKIEGYNRKAYLKCNVALNKTDVRDPEFSCSDNSTTTICPWEDTLPNFCFDRSDVSFAPTSAPTAAPKDNTGKIVGGVIGGLCGVAIIAIIVVFYVKSKEEEERTYESVSGDD